MFQSFNNDGDGYITADDLRKCMREFNENVTDDELAKFVVAADNDGDGRVSYEEFVQVMNKLNLF